MEESNTTGRIAFLAGGIGAVSVKELSKGLEKHNMGKNS